MMSMSTPHSGEGMRESRCASSLVLGSGINNEMMDFLLRQGRRSGWRKSSMYIVGDYVFSLIVTLLDRTYRMQCGELFPTQESAEEKGNA